MPLPSLPLFCVPDGPAWSGLGHTQGGPALDCPGLDVPGLDGPGLLGPGLDGPGLLGPASIERKNKILV